MIHQFDYPAIKGITSSTLVRFFAPVIDNFVLLNYSIMRLFDFYSDYRQFANSDIDLNMTVVETFFKATKEKPINIEELGERGKKYVNRIFTYNWTIHVRLIGGCDSKNSICLFRTYNDAKKSLERFKSSFKREPLPSWFWFGHILAAVFFLGAISLILAWFGQTPLTNCNGLRLYP